MIFSYLSHKKMVLNGYGMKIIATSSTIAYRDITQSFKTLVGGELKAYTDMMNQARDLSTERMIEEAKKLGADAIVNIRYSSASIMQGAAEVMAYGTAVCFKK